MLKFIFGLMILIIPLLLINRFEDKKKGAYAVLAGILGLQFFIALITQIFGFFNYLNILILNLIVCFVVIFKTDFVLLKENLKKIKVDWMFIFVLLV
jgi:hypothetical protein